MIDLNKEKFALLVKEVLASYYVVYRDDTYEREHFEIGGNHEELVELAFNENEGRIILFKNSDDYVDRDYVLADEFISKDVGEICIQSSGCSDDGERLVELTFYLDDEIGLEAKLIKVSSTDDVFISGLSEHFSDGLAQSLIAQLGGQIVFHREYTNIVPEGADAGFKGITSNEDILDFFDKNTEQLANFAEVFSWDMNQDGAEALILSSFANDSSTEVNKTYTADDIMHTLHPDDFNEKPSDECRLAVARMLVLNAVDLLALKYHFFRENELSKRSLMLLKMTTAKKQKTDNS